MPTTISSPKAQTKIPAALSDRVREDFNAVLAFIPHGADTMNNLGVASFMQGRMDKARTAAERILNTDAQNDEVREELALKMPGVLDRIEKFFTRDLRGAFLNEVVNP